MTMARISVVWASIGTISRRARPTSSEVRDSGDTSSRSCEPVNISCISEAPTIDEPIRQDIATMPGTNHCSAEVAGPCRAAAARTAPGRPAAASARSACPKGSRSSGRSSRVRTLAVSVTRVVWVLMLLLLRGWCGGRWSSVVGRRQRRPRAGCARSGRGRRRRASGRRPRAAGPGAPTSARSVTIQAALLRAVRHPDPDHRRRRGTRSRPATPAGPVGGQRVLGPG